MGSEYIIGPSVSIPGTRLYGLIKLCVISLSIFCLLIFPNLNNSVHQNPFRQIDWVFRSSDVIVYVRELSAYPRSRNALT